MEKTITQLEQEFEHTLKLYGATYDLFGECQRNGRRRYGRHLAVYIAPKFPIDRNTLRVLKALVTRYYGEPLRISVSRNEIRFNDSVYREVTFVLEK